MEGERRAKGEKGRIGRRKFRSCCAGAEKFGKNEERWERVGGNK
jgi:hypothetical protein